MKPYQKRFEEKIMPEPTSGCWLWTAYILKGGYGLFGIDGNNRLAHRVSYQIYKGNIPDGLLVCHACDTRSCVNPDHLFLGTYKDNHDDMDKKGRRGTYDRPKGENALPAKLKLKDVLEIRRLSSLGMKGADIHKLYQVVTVRTIYQIIAREKWASF